MIQIGVPVLNRGDLLRSFLESIDVPARVLVIFNSLGLPDESVDETLGSWVSNSRGIEIEIERIHGNLGVAGSWNAIIARFGGDCVICNNDMTFAPGVLSRAHEEISQETGAIIQHLHAAVCFYVPADFVKRAGWFDENIYPAYCEDQEMSLRCRALGLHRSIVRASKDGIFHQGSQTITSSKEPIRRFLQAAHAKNRLYLQEKWGRVPSGAEPMERLLPFGDPTLKPRDWKLDITRREELARTCELNTGQGCPVVFYRQNG